MQVVRWTVPADLPCYGDYDFRMYPGTFDLYLDLIVDSLALVIAHHRQHFRNIPKHWGRYRSYIDTMAALDWLTDAAKSGADVILWDNDLEDSIWVLAGTWIYAGQFALVRCPECNSEYRAGDGSVREWAYGSGFAAHGGHRYVCPRGHTLNAIMEWNS